MSLLHLSPKLHSVVLYLCITMKVDCSAASRRSALLLLHVTPCAQLLSPGCVSRLVLQMLIHPGRGNRSLSAYISETRSLARDYCPTIHQLRHHHFDKQALLSPPGRCTPQKHTAAGHLRFVFNHALSPFRVQAQLKSVVAERAAVAIRALASLQDNMPTAAELSRSAGAAASSSCLLVHASHATPAVSRHPVVFCRGCSTAEPIPAQHKKMLSHYWLLLISARLIALCHWASICAIRCPALWAITPVLLAHNCCARSMLAHSGTHQPQVGAHDRPVHAGVAPLRCCLSWVSPWAMLPAV
jgi:hypothetical protein